MYLIINYSMGIILFKDNLYNFNLYHLNKYNKLFHITYINKFMHDNLFSRYLYMYTIINYSKGIILFIDNLYNVNLYHLNMYNKSNHILYMYD